MIISIPLAKIDLDKYRVDLFLKELSSDIRYVRKVNQTGKKDVYIVIVKNDSQNGYALRENGKFTKSVFLPKGAQISSKIRTIIFNRNGSLDLEGGLTITVSNKGKFKELTIVPVSGRVLIKEGIYG